MEDLLHQAKGLQMRGGRPRHHPLGFANDAFHACALVADYAGSVMMRLYGTSGAAPVCFAQTDKGPKNLLRIRHPPATTLISATIG